MLKRKRSDQQQDNNNNNNTIIFTEKQSKRNQSFLQSLEKRKRKKQQETNTKTSNVKKSKNNKLKWVKSGILPNDNDRCLFIKENGKRCKAKRESTASSSSLPLPASEMSSSSLSSSTQYNIKYCKYHSKVDDIQYGRCKGCSKAMKQCQKYVLKKDVFCKRHLIPLYAKMITKLKNEWKNKEKKGSLSSTIIDEIYNHPIWKWNQINKNYNTSDNEDDRDNQDKSVDNDIIFGGSDDDGHGSYDEFPFDFSNTKLNHLNQLRKSRLQSSKLNNKNSSVNNDNNNNNASSNKKKKKKNKLKKNDPNYLIKIKRKGNNNNNNFKKITREEGKNKSIITDKPSLFISNPTINHDQPSSLSNTPPNPSIDIQSTQSSPLPSLSTTMDANTKLPSIPPSLPNPLPPPPAPTKKQPIFFGKVTSILDELGWNDDDDDEDQ